jgi:hypothetical protein
MLSHLPASARPATAARRPLLGRRARVVATASLLLAMALTTIGQASAAGNVHAVAVTGSDSAAGTEAAPWRTIQHALISLVAGDTLIVHGGTYTEHVSASLHAGTSSAPILVRAAAGERPIVKGLMWLTGPTWWTIDGLNVTWDPATDNASQHMVKFNGGSNWTFENSEVWGAHSYAGILVGSNPSNWRITHDCIHDTYPSNSTNQDHNIYVNSSLSAGPGSIDHNILFNATNGRNVKLGAPTISTTAGTQNVSITYNTMFNANQNVSISGGSRNNTIDHNILDKSLENHLIYGYSLTGIGNVASNNVGFESTKLIDGTGIKDAGGNVFPRDPKFDATAGCGGFHPSDSAVQGFGAYAGATAPTATPAPTTTPSPTPTASATATPTASPSPSTTPTPTATLAPIPTPTPTATAPSAIVSHGSTAAGNATTTTLVVATPAGTTAGDLLLAAVTVRGGTSPTVTAPAGWALVRSDAISTTVAQYVYRRLAGSTEPATWTWTFSKSESAAGTVSAFAGVDPTNPIAASSGSPNATSSASIATVATTASRSTSLLVGLFGIARATTIAAPTSMTAGAQAASSGGTYLAASEVSSVLLPAAGGTGAPSAVAGTSFVSIGQLVVLNPAS